MQVDPDKVSVRSLVRSRRYEWRSISGTRIVETEPVAPFHWGIGESGGGLRADVESSKAYIVLCDHSVVRLTGFEAAARGSGLSGESATPTEVKVAALRRYRCVVVGPRPDDA